jgi:outer membrane receptor protein involved in Fe transport
VKNNSMRGRLLASSMIGGVALVSMMAPQAFAETNPTQAAGAQVLEIAQANATPNPAPGAGVQVQELVVTGSRIPQPNLTSVSPVQVVNAQEVAIQGRPATIDILNQLPQTAINSQSDLGSSSNPLNGPGGVATVDLRGLGPQRTLVLVNGRRLGIGDPNTGNPNPAPDINQIPSQLIDRVEVLTGGASATYGSDAVAGVVNFIMKHNFEGVQLDVQEGVNQHGQGNSFMQNQLTAAGVPIPGGAWDGRSADYSLIAGANAPDGKGNVTVYATYHSQNPVFFGARDWAACQLNENPTLGCAGSQNSNYFTRSDGTGPAFSVLGNSFVPNGTPGTTPPALFNSNPYESLIQQDTRYTAGYFANYEVNPVFNLYSEFSFMHDETQTQIAPSGFFLGSGVTANSGFLVNCSNPFLSAQQAGAIGCASSADSVDLLIGRRNIEGGPRQSTYDHDNFRIVLGTKGKLFGPFSYDLYGSYYQTSAYQANTGYFSQSRAQNALLVGGTAANPVCLSGGSCVPLNIFQDGGVTQAALDYLTEAGTSRGTTTERIIEGTITGDLGEYGIKSPFATDAVGVSAGFQHRRDTLTFAPDAAELSGDLSGFGGASVAINNSLSVTEGYGEVRVPVVQDMPFMHDVVFNGGYRFSSYSTGVNASTYKLGLDWAPTSDIRFRGGFNRAIRAPNILELYTPQVVTNTSQVGVDPCAGTTPTASLEACERTGVTPAQYGRITQCPSEQCAVLQGGNTNLNPEKANTYTVGAVLTPKAIPGLYASIDYFHINITGLITNVPLGVSLNNCLTVGTLCENIVRNPANGILFGTTVGAGGYIVGTNVNLGAEETSGIDVQGSYKLGLDTFGHDAWGSLVFSFTGTFTQHYKVTPIPGEDTYDCAGLFGPTCQNVLPKWRHVMRVTWNAPHDVQVSAAWRRIGSTTLETDTDQPIIGQGTTDAFSHSIPAVNYLDLAANWNVNEKLAIRAGINNIFDRDPPIVANDVAGITGLPNTYPTYDLLGRHLFVAFTARF